MTYWESLENLLPKKMIVCMSMIVIMSKAQARKVVVYYKVPFIV